MKNSREVTQESFDKLLGWLAPDRENAGKRYEMIRGRLIKIFTCRGCFEPEDLADETINRVTFKLEEIRTGYTGDPALYFYGVAQKVHLESLRKTRPVPLLPPPSRSPDELEHESQCLDRCMRRLPPEQRELILEYYKEQKRAKIDHRKGIAERLGIPLNALRIRAHRIRNTLQQCVFACLEGAGA